MRYVDRAVPERSAAARYTVAIVLVVAAVLVTILLPQFLAPMRFFFLWVAVLGAALYGGVIAGLFATALAAFAMTVFVFGPGFTLHVTNPTDGTRYRAETMGPCLGLDFATRLAFVNRGGFNNIDRFSSVVLADGTRCGFQSFDQLKSPDSKALDEYEKAAESFPTRDPSAENPSAENSESKPK